MSDRAVCIVKDLGAEGRRHLSLPARQGECQASCGQRGRGSSGAGAVRAGEVDGETQAEFQGMILRADSGLLMCTGLVGAKERSPILAIRMRGVVREKWEGAAGFLR